MELFNCITQNWEIIGRIAIFIVVPAAMLYGASAMIMNHRASLRHVALAQSALAVGDLYGAVGHMIASSTMVSPLGRGFSRRKKPATRSEAVARIKEIDSQLALLKKT